MQLILRLIFIAILYLLIYAFFPETTGGGRVFLWVSFFSVSILTLLLSLFFFGAGLSKSVVFNMLFNIFMIAVLGYSLLNLYPQEDNVSALDKLKKGDIATYEEVKGNISSIFSFASKFQKYIFHKFKVNEKVDKYIKDIADEVEEFSKQNTQDVSDKPGEE